MSETRQMKRARLRAVLWDEMSGDVALRDDNGIIRRSVRRDMWIGRVIRAWKERQNV